MKTEKKLKEKSQAVSKSWPRQLNLYRACVHNAGLLISEAEILYSKKRYARAYFLAFTALEELGKAQLVADYLTDCISEEEFLGAFRRHDLKVAYLYRHLRVCDRPGEGKATLEYDLNDSKEQLRLRMASLYVGLTETNEMLIPDEHIDSKTAMATIEEAKEHFGSMLYAEWLNQRIGSKGLFK